MREIESAPVNRELGRRRLRALTRAALLGSAAATVVLGGLAAATYPGAATAAGDSTNGLSGDGSDWAQPPPLEAPPTPAPVAVIPALPAPAQPALRAAGQPHAATGGSHR